MLVFFNDTATTEIYTLSLHDALPISRCPDHALDAELAVGPGDQQAVLGDRAGYLAALDPLDVPGGHPLRGRAVLAGRHRLEDRKSKRLNSSHDNISYAVFCFKKKTTT